MKFEPIDKKLESFLFSYFNKRFGFLRENFSEFYIFQQNSSHVGIAPKLLTEELYTDSIIDGYGMSFARVKMKIPKLTTQAVMRFGHFAKKNLLNISAKKDAERYLAREAISLKDSSLSLSHGQIIVCYRGISLGLAYLNKEKEIIESLFPKAWSHAFAKKI